MPIFVGCIPESSATCVIFDEGSHYALGVFGCFGMFADGGQGVVTRLALQPLIDIARQFNFVLEEV